MPHRSAPHAALRPAQGSCRAVPGIPVQGPSQASPRAPPAGGWMLSSWYGPAANSKEHPLGQHDHGRSTGRRTCTSDLFCGPGFSAGAALSTGLLSRYFRTFGHQAFRKDHAFAEQPGAHRCCNVLCAQAMPPGGCCFSNKLVFPSPARDSSADLVCSDSFVLLLPPNITLAALAVRWLLASTSFPDPSLLHAHTLKLRVFWGLGEII